MSMLAASVETARRAPDRLLPLRALGSYDDYLHRYGPLPSFARDRELLLAQVERSGLTGRGGAGFPTARKLRAVARGRSPVVVANGTEGEPASAKDKTLLARNPHLVLDGILVAAEAVGADEAIIAVSRNDAGGYARIEGALRSRPALRRLVRLGAAPERFVAGEESALVNWLGDGPAKPTSTPPRPFERGLRGRPTLVQNVETLASLALIARRGADWFRGLGTDDEPGSVLVTVLGAVARPDVLEAELGTPLAELLDRCGGLTEAPGVLLVGGYFGSWLHAGALDMTLSQQSLGVPLGARTIAVLPRSACGVAETARVVRYLAGESAGQCGPCLFGLDALANAVENVASAGSEAHEAFRRLDRLGAQISGRGACAHPDGAVRLLVSALDVFRDELAAHTAGRCTSPGHEPVLPVPPTSRGGWR